MHSAEAPRSGADVRLAAWATALLIPIGFVAIAGLTVWLIDMPRLVGGSVVTAAGVIGVALGFREASRIDGTSVSWSSLMRVTLVVGVGLVGMQLAGAAWTRWVPTGIRDQGALISGVAWLIAYVFVLRRVRRARDRRSVPGHYRSGSRPGVEQV